MRRTKLSLLALAALGVTMPVHADAAEPVTRIILVGDSTMAHGSGYGDSLCGRFATSVVCRNMAKGGRSTSSYRGEGSWQEALDELATQRDTTRSYVLIQFGHNDQPGKPGRSTTLPEYTENLRRYVSDVRNAGAEPVLVTPLTRRQFKDGKVIMNLADWAAAMRAVAAEMKTPLLDLNKDSVAAVQKMGSTEANTLAQAPPPDDVVKASLTGTTIEAPKPPGNGGAVFDYTHLGEKGAAVFSAIVAEEIKVAIPGLAPLLEPTRMQRMR
jgi:lysophospholipase L1-like esterase